MIIHQRLLDEIYFCNDLFEASDEALAASLLAHMLSRFVLPLLIHPLAPLPPPHAAVGCTAGGMLTKILALLLLSLIHI